MFESKNKYFGRKKGKSFARLEQFQKYLVPPSKDFFKQIEKPRVLEIGIGDGEKISIDAKLNSKINYIGCDIFADGVLRAIRNSKENSLKNLVVFHLNIQDILPFIPAKYFDGIRVFFPDPWPKQRHHRRRIINRTLLDTLARLMRDGAELRVATDDQNYLVWILRHLKAHPDFAWTAARSDDWRRRPADWPNTRYEDKNRSGGPGPTFLRYLRCPRWG